MLNVFIPSGALFYGEPRRRTPVAFDASLRTLTQEVADGVHHLLQSGITPPAVYNKGCEACSIKDQCQPHLSERNSAKVWIDRQIKEALG